MDGSTQQQSVIENGKKSANIFKDASKNFSKGKIDNDSLQNNNNYSSQNQRSSFIPVRSRDNHQGKYALPKYNSRIDNQETRSHRNSAHMGNLSYPASPFPSPVRRHSLGVDDLSNDVSIHVNSNQSHRFQSLGRHRNSPPMPNTASIIYNITSQEQATNDQFSCKEALPNGHGNQNEKCQLMAKSSNNPSPLSFTPVYVEPLNEKAKDKSFIRKSSLNRLEFVDTAQVADGVILRTPLFYNPEQYSTSDANSDYLPRSETSSSIKRKNSFKNSKKETPGRLPKQDFPHPKPEKALSVDAAISPKLSGRAKWWYNKRTNFKKKSYSAGEQESLTDQSDSWKRENTCFSAQEIDSQEYLYKRAKKKVTLFEPQKPSSLPLFCTDNLAKDNDNNTGNESYTLNEQPYICDNTSQEVLKIDISDEPVSQNPEPVHLTPEMEVSETNLCQNKTNKESDDEELDKDLFRCPQSPTSSLSTPPFPTDCIQQNTLDAATTTTYNEHLEVKEDIAKVASELSSLEISTDSLESVTVNKSNEVDVSAQQNSILRKKQAKGILKNAASDERFAWQPLSILKHRESSEEKEFQSDLHSILKKSASEDEGSDIRPILKNTSTDEDSPGTAASKPKPILKKRTSFSEECSYACFLSGELKPILKKKIINESLEEQLKPILKIRRKSEEAAASISEFPLGTRPRAYSVDRGIRMPNERKLMDDDASQ